MKNLSKRLEDLEAKIIKTKNNIIKKKNTKISSLSLIPNGVFGISIYVLIILFCIWIFGDFGGECGVDYQPRFFGEC